MEIRAGSGEYLVVFSQNGPAEQSNLSAYDAKTK